uniref:Uncharacterized protein n=1 Tax=Anguilla anguilla TaxID=7936 RepID=A0A0E9WNV4_ANGAN
MRPPMTSLGLMGSTSKLAICWRIWTALWESLPVLQITYTGTQDSDFNRCFVSAICSFNN